MDINAIKKDQERFYDTAYFTCLEETDSRLQRFFNNKMFFTLYKFLNFIPDNLLRDKTILDAFCNRGMHFRFYKDHGASFILGCDISMRAMLKGKAQYKGPFEYIRGDCEDMPLKTESIDTICCFGGFHHSPRKEMLLSGFYEILRDGGMVIISDPNGSHIFRRLSDAVGMRFGFISPFENSLDPEETRELFASHGFKVLEMRYYNVFSEVIFHLTDIVAKKSMPLSLPLKLLLLLSRPLDIFLERYLLNRIPSLAWSYFLIAEKFSI